MEDSIASIEAILNYTFNDKKLLEEALTHSSYTDTPSYDRLEFIGDAALGLAISNFFYLTYPDVDQGLLTDLRAANITTEKFARVSVHHGLYNYVRHKAPALEVKVKEFVTAVKEEEGMVVHGGEVKAPKILADIVESIAAAVYVDCGFDLNTLWIAMRNILEPLVMLDDLVKQPQPIKMLFEACQKEGKHVDIKQWRNGQKSFASVYVDGKFVVSASSENKESAKLHVAEAAFSKIITSKSGDPTVPHTCSDFTKETEIEGAKQKVHELCYKKKWPKPIYNLEKELGPAHDRRYISSIKVEVIEMIFSVEGDERPRVKDAENSAASMMFRILQETGYDCLDHKNQSGSSLLLQFCTPNTSTPFWVLAGQNMYQMPISMHKVQPGQALPLEVRISHLLNQHHVHQP